MTTAMLTLTDAETKRIKDLLFALEAEIRKERPVKNRITNLSNRARLVLSKAARKQNKR